MPRPEVTLRGVEAAPATWCRTKAQKNETAGDCVYQAGGNIHAAAFSSNVKPDVIKVSFGLRRYTVRHYLALANSAIRRARPRSRTSAASSRMDS